MITDRNTSVGLAVQIEKLGGPMMDALAEKHRLEAAAAMLIARRLRAAESFTT